MRTRGRRRPGRMCGLAGLPEGSQLQARLARKAKKGSTGGGVGEEQPVIHAFSQVSRFKWETVTENLKELILNDVYVHVGTRYIISGAKIHWLPGRCYGLVRASAGGRC